MQEVFSINKIISLVFGMIIFSILAGYVKNFGKKKTGLYSAFFIITLLISFGWFLKGWI